MLIIFFLVRNDLIKANVKRQVSQHQMAAVSVSQMLHLQNIEMTECKQS